jgi:L-glyceraldehyde 3-phosphate reductase
LIGASRPEQIRDNVASLENPDFTEEELAEIDRYAKEGGVNHWARPSHDERP